MNLDWFFNSANWQTSFGVLVIFSMFGGFLWGKAKEMRRSAIIYSCALDQTKNFYRLADEIMCDPAIPETIHDMIYDMATFVTHDEDGRKVYSLLVEAFGQKTPKKGKIHEELIALGKHRLDLYEKVVSAVSTWLGAMACAYGHSDIKVTRTLMLDVNDRSRLFDITEKLLSWFKGGDHDGNNGGGRTVHAGHC